MSRNRHMIRISCIFSVLLSCFYSCRAAQEEPALAVTIIAVTSFAHGSDTLSNERLSQEIDAAAEHLRQFFETNYKVPVRVLKSPEQTTSPAIRNFLFNDLPRDSRQVHLIFVVSHGMEKTYPGSPANSELFIASSDTDNQKPEANAIRGEELLSAIGHLRDGTSAFLFLDTCNSASIGSFAARLSNLISSQTTLSRTMVLASALEDQYSYNARFTEALLRIWSSPRGHCSATPAEISSTLATAIKEVDPLSHATPQDVSLALRYATERDFCVESFMTGDALLILTNPTFNSFWVNFTPDNNSLGVIQVHPREVVPVRLSRLSYKIVISKSSNPEAVDNHVYETSLDFTNDFVKIQPVNEAPGSAPPNPDVLATLYQKTANLLETWQAGSTVEVAGLRETAKVAYDESLKENERQATDIAAGLVRIKQEVATAKTQVDLDSEAAKQATQDLALKGRSDTALWGASGTTRSAAAHSETEVASLNAGLQEPSRKAALAQSKLELSVEKLDKARATAASKEATLDEIQRLGLKEQQALNDVSLALVRAKILQDREKKCAEIVKSNLDSVGSFHQTSRGATLTIDGSDSLPTPKIRKLADFLVANPAITLELEYVVEGSSKSSAQYQSMAEAKLNAIRGQLLKLAVPTATVVVRGYGLQGPASKRFNLVFSPIRN